MRNAIEVEALSKRYLLGEHHGVRRSLRDVLTGGARTALARGRRLPREELWSLRDVDLTVAEGEAVGVIGRNGAGKSTLLKILTRITEPTYGVARTRGRVGSLLEVGIGFHPELTGRENVYLNGALLGMGRRAIAERFDEIVDFAGVPRFVDTPVKRYSSGMYLRLAFAVAAHLDAEIMVVDEVLAVGDAEFQRRCLGKMGSLGRQGRTVVFVSHHLDAILRLCPRAIWLDRGQVRARGPAGDVVDAYLAAGGAMASRRDFPEDAAAPATLRRVRVLGTDGVPRATLPRDRPFTIELRLRVRERTPGLDLTVFLQNLRGVRVLEEAWSESVPGGRGAAGDYLVEVTVPPVLAVGEYVVGTWVGSSYDTFVYEDDVLRFRLEGDTQGRPERVVQLGLPFTVRRMGDVTAVGDGLGRTPT